MFLLSLTTIKNVRFAGGWRDLLRYAKHKFQLPFFAAFGYNSTFATVTRLAAAVVDSFNTRTKALLTTDALIAFKRIYIARP